MLTSPRDVVRSESARLVCAPLLQSPPASETAHRSELKPMPTIASGDVSIHYGTAGSGSPVLLLPGLAGHGRAWGPQVELFARNHLVIVPDHRGTGRSTPTGYGQTIAQHAADFAALLRALDV